MSDAPTDALTLLADAAARVESGSLVLAAAIAVAAGLVSFLSPCVFPLVPGYLSFVAGLSGAELSRDDPAGRRSTAHMFLGGLLFVLGFSLVFVSLGTAVGVVGDLLRDHQRTLSVLFGTLTILLGLYFAGVLRVAWLDRDVRARRAPSVGLAGAPVLGAMFGLGWTPCIGPTLAAVLGLAASTSGASAARGAALAFAYCLGLGLPFLVAAVVFERALASFAVVRRNSRVVMVVGGAMLVAIGVLEITGLWQELVDLMQRELGSPSLPL